jgi:hypothetical protein
VFGLSAQKAGKVSFPLYCPMTIARIPAFKPEMEERTFGIIPPSNGSTFNLSFRFIL